MKRVFFLIFILFLIGTLTGEIEKVDIPQDQRNWVYVGKTKAGEAAFVIMGDTGSEWREAIIFRFIPTPENTPLTVFFEQYNQMIIKDKRIETKVLESRDDFLLFEWWTDTTKKDAQHGWIQITKAPGGVKLFRYTTKLLTEIEEISKKWEYIMNEYTFTMTPYNFNLNINWNNAGGNTWFENKDRSGVIKYYPEGQYANGWNEKITLILVGKYIEYPLSTHFKAVVENLKRDHGNDIIITPIIMTENSLLFQWSNDSTSELYKIEKFPPSSSVIMRYTTKNGDEDIITWKEIFENLNITIDYRYNIVPLNEANSNESTISFEALYKDATTAQSGVRD